MFTNHFLLNLAVFFLTAVLSALFTRAFIGFCYRLNFLDYPTERKNHKTPMPFMGGVSLFCSFWVIVFLGVSLAVGGGDPLGVLPLVPKLVGIFCGSLIVLTVGFLDDKYRWSPMQKLLGQMAAALILMKLGLTINLVSELGILGYAITFLWILLIINAFNLVDYLDGHCAGIALVSTVTFFWLTQIIGQAMVGLFLVTFTGALLGFLYYNFKPAKIYLGDNGSLFIGYMMAAFTLLCRYQAPTTTYATIFMPVLMFGIPIYDTVSVAALRLAKGIPPWRGDRNHFAHRLVNIGMSERMAVGVSYFLSMMIGFIAILLTQVGFFGAMLIGLLFLSVITMVAFIEYVSSRKMCLGGGAGRS
ncbi:MAG: undecaprenyl/decaprenyl-phosphate alpha-N-acetylglucosaminyl 1-phosphate transferase [Candidatus Omnitrophica bacterium]|nr:undecaprenyl/decaprenyl-phosphate alpha-N-acetylglucosaminyl 1-phosphate transferase [Candidatus Omnitrophota bacterium]